VQIKAPRIPSVRLFLNFRITIFESSSNSRTPENYNSKRMSDSDSAIVDTPFKEAIAVKIIGTEGNTTILTGNAPWDWSNRG
jgi:hypothetical protein